MQALNSVEIFASFMVLFAVIDITGALPIILDIKKKTGVIEAEKICLTALVIMVMFLFSGKGLLGIFGVDITSFAIAGAFILFLLSLEMILGVELFKDQTNAGAGSITSLISLKSEYADINILIALLLNLVVVYAVLKATRFFEKILGNSGIHILKKMFGIILLAMAIRLFLSNTGIEINH